MVVLPDPDAVGHAAAQRLVAALGDAIGERGEAHLALTGGSSALMLYTELAADWRDAVDWLRVHLWWGDERLVPVDHPESNTGLAYRLLLNVSARSAESGTGSEGVDVEAGDAPGLPIPAANVHPFSIAPAAAASDAAMAVAEGYAAELAARLPTGRDGLPAFDIILLGVGPDGHILSAFPGSPALAPDAPIVVAVPAPDHVGPQLPRVSLNPRLLESARHVLVMVAGDDKAEIVARALSDPAAEPSSLPARLAVRPNAVWLLDEAAAGSLPRRAVT